MRCLAVCQTELAIRMLDEILLPSFDVDFLVESKPLARKLHDNGLSVSAGDLRRTDTYLKAEVTPGTCVVVEDNGRRSLKKILEAIWDAGGTLVYVLGVGTSHTQKREEELKAQFPELSYLALSELFGGPLLTEFSRSLTRLKVHSISASSATPIASSSFSTTTPIRMRWPADLPCATSSGERNRPR